MPCPYNISNMRLIFQNRCRPFASIYEIERIISEGFIRGCVYNMLKPFYRSFIIPGHKKRDSEDSRVLLIQVLRWKPQRLRFREKKSGPFVISFRKKDSSSQIICRRIAGEDSHNLFKRRNLAQFIPRAKILANPLFNLPAV